MSNHRDNNKIGMLLNALLQLLDSWKDKTGGDCSSVYITDGLQETTMWVEFYPQWGREASIPEDVIEGIEPVVSCISSDEGDHPWFAIKVVWKVPHLEEPRPVLF